MRFSSFTCAAGVLVTVLLAGNGRCASSAAANLELVEQALDGAVNELLTEMPVQPGVLSIEAGDGPTASVVAASLAAAWRRRGFAAADQAGASQHIDITIRSFGVTVPETKRSYVVGTRKAHRRADVELAAVLTDPSGTVVATANASGSAEDWVTIRELELAKGPSGMGLDPALPRSAWARWTEPLIVTCSVGVVLYLFFTK